MEVYTPPAPDTLTSLQAPRLVDISDGLNLANQDPGLARDLLRMLLKGLHDDEQELSRLYREKDHKGLFERVHRLHGGCCYCGVPRLRAATEQLQELLRPMHEQDAPQIDREIYESAYEQVRKEIRNLRDWAADQDLEALFGLEQPIEETQESDKTTISGETASH